MNEVTLWRPDRIEWFNRYRVEDDLNARLAAGWTLLVVLPVDRWSGEVPTFVFQRRRVVRRWWSWLLHMGPDWNGNESSGGL